MDLNRLFADAESAFRTGDLHKARDLLGQVLGASDAHPQVLHLLALVEKGRGDQAAAQSAFESALRLAPADPRICNNYGNLMLSLDRADAAIVQFDRALAAEPNFTEARFNRALALEKASRFDEALIELDRLAAASPPTARLFAARGSVLLALDRAQDAAEAFDQALELDPRRRTALEGRARAAMVRGESNASSLYAEALTAAPDDRVLQLAYAEALEAEGDPSALDVVARLVASSPGWPEGQTALARMRWAAGEGESFVRDFTRALQDRPADADLWAAYIASLTTADLWTEAADAAEEALHRVDSHELRLTAAARASDAGNPERAEELFATLPRSFPGRRRAEIRHFTRGGQYDRALQLAEEDLAEDRWDVSSWAMIGLLWRLVGDDRAHWLHEQSGLVATQDLELNPDEIERIATVLRGLHTTRAHPLGQSLRGGTQTRGKLFDREDAEIRRLRAAIERGVERHWAGLPPLDVGHPLLRHRDRRPRFTGSWSVRLTDGGFHVAHIHEGGVISSACYLVVPASREPQEGWLEIGRPPPELNVALQPLVAVEPQPGRLALFPSTLLHGTRPFAQGERLTVAFDIVAQ